MTYTLSATLRERIGSLTLVGVGLLLVSQGLSMPLGTLASFGPGLFPTIIGSLMVLVAGGLVLFPERLETEEEGSESFAWRSMLFVSAGMIAFSLLIKTTGLVPATLAVVLLSSCGDRTARPLQAIALAIVMALLGTTIFIWGLNLPLAIVRW
jgi:hypothetical protein